MLSWKDPLCSLCLMGGNVLAATTQQNLKTTALTGKEWLLFTIHPGSLDDSSLADARHTASCIFLPRNARGESWKFNLNCLANIESFPNIIASWLISFGRFILTILSQCWSGAFFVLFEFWGQLLGGFLILFFLFLSFPFVHTHSPYLPILSFTFLFFIFSFPFLFICFYHLLGFSDLNYPFLPPFGFFTCGFSILTIFWISRSWIIHFYHLLNF